jgi:hypothetical protein
LRHGAITTSSQTIQPVSNRKLEDLLTMWDFMNSSLQYREKHLSISFELDNYKDFATIREEININKGELSKLRLDNASFGSLVIPGPIKRFNDLTSESTGLSSDITFNYKSGWPKLDSNYLKHVDQGDVICPTVAELRSYRKKFAKQVREESFFDFLKITIYYDREISLIVYIHVLFIFVFYR